MARQKLTQHTDQRPVEIDAASMFNTAALGKKKAIDDTKHDAAQTHYSSPVFQRDNAPNWLSALVTLLEIITVVCWTLTLITGFIPECVFVSAGITICTACLFVLKKRFAKAKSAKD